MLDWVFASYSTFRIYWLMYGCIKNFPIILLLMDILEIQTVHIAFGGTELSLQAINNEELGYSLVRKIAVLV